MYHYTWQWSYTVITLLFLLSLFLIVAAALVLRDFLPRWMRRSQEPDIDIAQGIERARERNYVNPRGD